MGKHLLDETAEFKMPKIARHAAEDDDRQDETQRWDPGFRRQPPVPAPQETRDR